MKDFRNLNIEQKAKIPANIIEIIHHFIEEAEKEKIHIQQAILFGSYATGKIINIVI